MHHLGIVLAGEDIAGAAHVGGKLINFFNSLDGLARHAGIAKVGENEFVGRRRRIFVWLQIDCPNPVAFLAQSAYEVAANKPARPVDQNPFQILV